ncbi:unnamed protein product [Dibothriocephalus latus]|uniref:Glutamate-5-semialdehyde dehydrogenase n=1 Tax=Dibothriocephalus latus TaxID=60516 RepID=A0A3P7LEL4_DIBLA|nr:unnamed protein product [Dibothriocephalus latus]
MLEGRGDVSQILTDQSSAGGRALVDLIIPRGSESLIKRVQAQVNAAGTGIPVLGHSSGVCHVYVDARADEEKARKIVLDSKCNYPAACNAMETLLLHEDHVKSGLAQEICEDLIDHEVEVFVGPKLRQMALDFTKTFKSAPSFSTEYSDKKCTVEIVSSLDEVIQHIDSFGSSHTDTIVTEDQATADKFLQGVDSACVFHNVSTRFADGYRFGLGAEVGISTGRIHARGPVGVEGLLTTKWILRGEGQLVGDIELKKGTYPRDTPKTAQAV